MAAGRPFVVRMHVPSEGVCTVKDQLQGDIEISWDQVDTQVLLKSTDANLPSRQCCR